MIQIFNATYTDVYPWLMCTVNEPICYYNFIKIDSHEIGVDKMFEIKGLDQLNKTLSELGKVTGELEGELGSIQFDAESAESIELAIVEMENIVDKKFENYASNPVAIDMADGIKAAYRQMIVDKASEARIQADSEENENGR